MQFLPALNQSTKKKMENNQGRVMQLKYLRHKAWQNARQQRARKKKNPNLRPKGKTSDEWIKIANDYTCEIKAIQKGKL